MALLVATLVLGVMAGLGLRLVWPVLSRLRTFSFGFRLWLLAPGMALGVLVFIGLLAWLGIWGLPAAVFGGLLALEFGVWEGWRRTRIAAEWRGMVERTLDEHPEVERRMQRSRFWRFLSRLLP